MFDKLSFIEQQHEELAKKISDPAVMADMANWQKLCKDHSDMTPIVEKYKEFFKNGKMDDGTDFGYEIKVVSIEENADGGPKAVIRITRK